MTQKIVKHRRLNDFPAHLSKARKAAVLAAAVAALAIATIILFGVLKAAVNHQREIRTQRYQLQADVLANAGLNHAMAQLRKTGSYQGETWRLAADELDGSGPAEVSIRVETVSNQPDDLHITAQADYPSDTEHRARKTHATTIHRK